MIYGDDNIIEDQVDKIFKQVDLDNSGHIEYNEWMIATINKQSLLDNKKLKKAFNYIDIDGGGSLSVDEVRDALFNG